MADSYFDIDNRHQIYVGRLATHLINEHPNKSLTASYKLARSILNDAGELTTRKKRNKVMKALTEQLADPVNAMWLEMTTELEAAAENEAAFSAKTINSLNDVALVVPTAEAIISHVNKAPMKLEGAKENAWLKHVKRNSNSIAKVYNQKIKTGYSEDKTLYQITKDLRKVTDGILRNNAEALARTGVSHYSNQAKMALANANKDIVKNKYFNSVFDNRRTLICANFAVNPVYAVDDSSAPVLPLHFGERTTWLLLIGDQKHPFGDRPAIGGADGDAAAERYDRRLNALNKRRDNPNIDGTTTSKVKYRGRKDADTFKVENISGGTDIDEWYRSQPSWWIESNMGKKRADMYINGDFSISKFTDLTGVPLTLAQLKASGI